MLWCNEICCDLTSYNIVVTRSDQTYPSVSPQDLPIARIGYPYSNWYDEGIFVTWAIFKEWTFGGRRIVAAGSFAAHTQRGTRTLTRTHTHTHTHTHKFRQTHTHTQLQTALQRREHKVPEYDLTSLSIHSTKCTLLSVTLWGSKSCPDTLAWKVLGGKPALKIN